MKQKLYIIHGWTYTVDPWAKTISLLKEQGISVEMLHVPGLTAPSQKVWTIEDYVRWADRHLPAGAVALGHSNGGRILLNLCAEKPDKLSHLILLDAAGVYEPSKKRSLIRSLSKTFGFLKKVPGISKVWHKVTGSSDYARAPENMKQTLSNMLDSDRRLKLSQVTTPTSILWGAADTVTPPRQAKVMHESIKDSTLQIFPKWTHAPYISHPAELAKAIARALKQAPEQRPMATDFTEASSISASLAMKKAAEPEVPDTAAISATLAMKKATGPAPQNTTTRSAAFAVPSKNRPAPEPYTTPARPEPALKFEHLKLEIPERKVISTASVPKKSSKKPKKSPKAPKTRKRP